MSSHFALSVVLASLGFLVTFVLCGPAPDHQSNSMYAQKNVDSASGSRDSEFKGKGAVSNQDAHYRGIDAQSAHASDTIFSALRAKSKGNQSSKGARASHKESHAEAWEDKNEWNEELDMASARKKDADARSYHAQDAGMSDKRGAIQVEHTKNEQVRQKSANYELEQHSDRETDDY